MSLAGAALQHCGGGVVGQPLEVTVGSTGCQRGPGPVLRDERPLEGFELGIEGD